MGLFDGRVVLISGSGGGQGRAASLAFTREGASVFGCDVAEASSRETVELVRAAGGEMTAMAPLDVSDPEGARRWVETAVETYGGIDVLYNNGATARLAPITEISIDEWRTTMTGELDVVFFPTKFAWPHLVARGGGVVVNTASLAAQRGSLTQGIVAHCAGKAGVVGMTKQMAAEGAAHGIRAVSISPGPISTPGFDGRYPEGHPVRVELASTTLLERLGRPEEIAEVAVFLASDRASYVTGIDVPVDGGMSVL